MNIEQIADAVSQEMLMHVATLQPELVKWNREYLSRCLSKLKEQDVEPVAVVDDIAMHKDGYRIFNGIGEVYTGQRLYTESQLIAAQQRTAEACAKVAVEWGNAINDQYCGNALRNYADAISKGDWREYL